MSEHNNKKRKASVLDKPTTQKPAPVAPSAPQKLQKEQPQPPASIDNSRATKKQKQAPTPQPPVVEQPEQLPYHGLYILPITDITPTPVYEGDNNEEMNAEVHGQTRFLYWTPKVATFDIPEITEEQAQALEQDDLYERLRVERTVLVYGVPVVYNENCLKHVFSYFGQVEEVFFHPFHNDYFSRVAEITMIDDESYENIIDKFAETKIQINTDIAMLDAMDDDGMNNNTAQYEFGVNKYFTQYMQLRPDYTALQQQVDTFMMAFDDRTEALRKAGKKPVVDDEGFILVTGDDKTFDMAQKKFKQQVKDKKKRVELKLQEARENELQFYKFHEDQKQQKEEHKARSDLNRDKRIIQQLKEKRTFNPL